MADLVGEDGLKYRSVTKKDAALRQIGIAIKMLVQGEYEAAITLAGAAEGMMVTGGMPTPMFESLRERRPADFETEAKWVSFLNETLHWLKHNGDQETRTIGEFDAWLMISRALTKYHGTFGEAPHEKVEAVITWAQNRKRKG
jgi:hypothetical protein